MLLLALLVLLLCCCCVGVVVSVVLLLALLVFLLCGCWCCVSSLASEGGPQPRCYRLKSAIVCHRRPADFSCYSPLPLCLHKWLSDQTFTRIPSAYVLLCLHKADASPVERLTTGRTDDGMIRR